MPRTQLQQLAQPELIEIILRQQALIQQLQARVAELEEQIKRLIEPPKDCINSSIPPSQSPKPNRANCPSKKGPPTRPSGPRSQSPPAGRDRGMSAPSLGAMWR